MASSSEVSRCSGESGDQRERGPGARSRGTSRYSDGWPWGIAPQPSFHESKSDDDRGGSSENSAGGFHPGESGLRRVSSSDSDSDGSGPVRRAVGCCEEEAPRRSGRSTDSFGWVKGGDGGHWREIAFSGGGSSCSMTVSNGLVGSGQSRESSGGDPGRGTGRLEADVVGGGDGYMCSSVNPSLVACSCRPLVKASCECGYGARSPHWV